MHAFAPLEGAAGTMRVIQWHDFRVFTVIPVDTANPVQTLKDMGDTATLTEIPTLTLTLTINSFPQILKVPQPVSTSFQIVMRNCNGARI
jgi:hypothetical protein